MKNTGPEVCCDRTLDLFSHDENFTHAPLSFWKEAERLNTEIKPLLLIFIQFALLSLQFTLFYTDFGHLIGQVNSVNPRLI